MSELAFNANGDSFEVPANVTGWRVRRLKPRGAPELVYGRDGRPLTIGIESDVHDLREAVGGVLGRYRLDPVNDDGKTVDSVPAAYVQVVKAERNAAEATPHPPAPVNETDGVVREAMRLNTELARSVVEKFPEMMTAAAELLRAADGAGIPARAPRVSEDGTIEDDEQIQPRFDLNALVAQVVPMLIMSLGNSKMKMPDISAVLDWRKATPEAKKLPAKSPRTARPDGPGDSTSAETHASERATDALPPIDPQTMAHFIAIQSALKPDEAAMARDVAGNLPPAELRAWFDELSKLSVPQAVQKIRVLIAGNTEAVS